MRFIDGLSIWFKSYCDSVYLKLSGHDLRLRVDIEANSQRKATLLAQEAGKEPDGFLRLLGMSRGASISSRTVEVKRTA